jgi:hypothetical protein
MPSWNTLPAASVATSTDESLSGLPTRFDHAVPLGGAVPVVVGGAVVVGGRVVDVVVGAMVVVGGRVVVGAMVVDPPQFTAIVRAFELR